MWGWWLSLAMAAGVLAVYYRRRRLVLAMTLISRLLEQPERPQFAEGPGFAIISYKRLGRTYNVYLPYRRREIPHDSNYKVYLIRGEKRIDITQQPGIPYFLTPEDLGGSGYELYDNVSGELLDRRNAQELITRQI